MPRPSVPRRPVTPRAATVVAVLAGWLLLAGAPATAGALVLEPTPDPDLEQSVSGAEATVREAAVVDVGHVDIGPRFTDGAWTLEARDDRTVPQVWRDVEDTVIHLTDAGIVPAPDSPDYAFLGAAPGDPLYVVPQAQNQDVVWLGWNTQDPEVTEQIDRGATLTLDGVTGPGELFLFLQEGVTGPPNVLWDSTGELPQDLWMEVNTHTHANWVFTQPGTYALDVTVSATLTGGEEVTDSSTLRVVVGSGTDPAEALAGAVAAQDEPAPAQEEDAAPADVATDPGTPAASTDAEDTGRDTADTTAAEAAAAEGSTSTVALWVGGAAAALLLAVAVSVVRSRRARASVDSEAQGR